MLAVILSQNKLVWLSLLNLIWATFNLISKLSAYKSIESSGGADAPGQYKPWIKLAVALLLVIL